MEKVKGLCVLKMRVWELFKQGEGISTPGARHKGRLPLIECANHDFKIMYFPCLCFYVFFLFMLFFMFFLPFYVFYFFVVDKGVSLALMYSPITTKK